MTKKVVVMGGGTGTFPVIAALKELDVQLSSIIAVSDSGGSSGRIRDEFGFQPVGDLRQALAALSEEKDEVWIRKLLLYRFSKGNGLQGHNLGNLILTALQDLTGSTSQALSIAEKIFRIQGHVIPATENNVQLEISYVDGSVAVGEHILDETPTELKPIDHVSLIPSAKISPQAQAAIETADVVIIGPGDYYASLMATLLPTGIKAAFAKSKAKVVYMMNLMTRFTQTHNMTAAQHLDGIEKVIGRQVDVVVINAAEIPKEILMLYEKEHEYPVQDDFANDQRIVRADLLNEELHTKSMYDTTHRSLLRHEAQKINIVLKKILQ